MKTAGFFAAFCFSLLTGGCISQTSDNALRNVDGFWGASTQTTLKERYDLAIVLPMAEDEFVTTFGSLGFELVYEGRPQDERRVMSIPQYPLFVRDLPADYAIVLMPPRQRSDRYHEKYIAYVFRGQVVAVENQLGAYTIF
jgi:hypothetical protein